MLFRSMRVWVARGETGRWEAWVPSKRGMHQVAAGLPTRETALQACRSALKNNSPRQTARA